VLVLGPRDPDVDVLAGVELQPAGIAHAQDEPADVARKLLDGLDLGGRGDDRHAAAQHLLVVVQQLDLDVGQRVRTAQQRVPLRLLEVGQGERRVAIEVDVAVEQERLAGRALPLLAAVHEHDALAESGGEDRLVLVDLHLDADGLQPRGVLLTHDRVLRRGRRRSARRLRRSETCSVSEREPAGHEGSVRSGRGALFGGASRGTAGPVLRDVLLALLG